MIKISGSHARVPSTFWACFWARRATAYMYFEHDEAKFPKMWTMLARSNSKFKVLLLHVLVLYENLYWRINPESIRGLLRWNSRTMEYKAVYTICTIFLFWNGAVTELRVVPNNQNYEKRSKSISPRCGDFTWKFTYLYSDFSNPTTWVVGYKMLLRYVSPLVSFLNYDSPIFWYRQPPT